MTTAPESAGPLVPITGRMLNMIAAAAANPDTDVAKLRELMAMQKELLADEAKRAFDSALAECQAEMVPIVRNMQNTSTSSKYADLQQIDEAIRPIYTARGFALSSSEEPSADRMELVIVTDVTHCGGHTRRYRLSGGVDQMGPKGTPNKTHIQGVGASVSYLRRYLTVMIFNLVLKNEDNDGQKVRNPTRIDEAQKQRIVAELQQTGTNPLKFLEWAEAKTVDDIYADQWPAIMDLFAARRTDKGLAPYKQPANPMDEP